MGTQSLSDAIHQVSQANRDIVLESMKTLRGNVDQGQNDADRAKLAVNALTQLSETLQAMLSAFRV